MTIAARATRLVNLKDFQNAGKPERCAELDLTAPAERQYVLRMPVRAGGEYLVPEELNWVQPMLRAAMREQQNKGIDHPFCYITVRHGIVDSTSDDEWHVDGFSMKVPHAPEQNYVWCSDVGTEYVNTNVTFPADFDPMRHNIHTFLAHQVANEPIEQCRAKTIYCMDPYLLHRRPSSTAGMMRTFVRISFVPIEINDVNNTQNPLLPRTYDHDGVAYRNALATYGMKFFPVVLGNLTGTAETEILSMVELWETSNSAYQVANTAAIRLFIERGCDMQIVRAPGFTKFAVMLVPDDLAVESLLTLPDLENDFHESINDMVVKYRCLPPGDDA